MGGGERNIDLLPHLFTHSLAETQPVFTEHLSYVAHCPGHRGCIGNITETTLSFMELSCILVRREPNKNFKKRKLLEVNN